MTTNATATAIAAPRRRIGLAAAWRIERTKIRTSWFLIGAVILAAFAQILGAWNYTTNLSAFQEQGITWVAIWAQGGIMVTTVFMPLLYVVFLAHAESLEYQTRGWQRMVSIDRIVPAMLGKTLVALELALIGMGVYYVAAVITGLLLGFRFTDPTGRVRLDDRAVELRPAPWLQPCRPHRTGHPPPVGVVRRTGGLGHRNGHHDAGHVVPHIRRPLGGRIGGHHHRHGAHLDGSATRLGLPLHPHHLRHGSQGSVTGRDVHLSHRHDRHGDRLFDLGGAEHRGDHFQDPSPGVVRTT